MCLVLLLPVMFSLCFGGTLHCPCAHSVASVLVFNEIYAFFSYYYFLPSETTRCLRLESTKWKREKKSFGPSSRTPQHQWRRVIDDATTRVCISMNSNYTLTSRYKQYCVIIVRQHQVKEQKRFSCHF